MKTILILAANPTGTTALQLDEEVRSVREALKQSQGRAEFRLEHRSAVRWKDVRRAIEETQPEVVHFSGHGKEEGLLLEEEDGSTRLIPADALKRMFALFSCVDCVVLNACYSAVQAEAIHQYVRCVVGMSLSIGDRAARDFAEAFYDGVGAGWDYGKAYKLGLSGIANDVEVYTPMLLREKDSVKASSKAIELESPDGRMSIESGFYVDRPMAETDGEREILKLGSLLRIKGPMEFGKSSLMGRVVTKAEQDGAKMVSINFREIDEEFLGSLNDFLRWFCDVVTDELNCEGGLDNRKCKMLGYKKACGDYFERSLLPQIANALVLELDQGKRTSNAVVI